MNFPEGLFSNELAFGAFLPYVLILLWCAWTAPWKRLADSGQINVWLGTVVVLTLMWSMKAGIKPGLNLHLLGATAFTLMFGRQLAAIGLSLVLAAVTFNSGELGTAMGWQPFALNALVMAVFPCFMASLILRGVERWLPPNVFVYIFAASFFGAALVSMSTGVFATTTLWLADIYPSDELWAEYFPYYILLSFSEAWLNGGAITMMVMYFPSWVGSFDDRRYLWNK
jgi:uncharacterized membrane protein